MSGLGPFQDRFQKYFRTPVAQEAAQSLKDSACILFQVAEERFFLLRRNGENTLVSQSENFDLAFTMTPQAAERILSFESQSIGEIGVFIAKLIVTQNESEKIRLKLESGFLTLFSKGYLGVVTAGGKEFGTFLASRGLSGLGAVKNAIKKLRSD